MNLSQVLERAKQFLTFRKLAYTRVFDLSNRDAQMVLEDLAKFCRAHESTFHADERVAGRLDGRREVWLRIQQHLQLSEDALWKLYHKGE